MSNQYLKLRRSNIPGKIPSTSSIDFGELALNTVDGRAYMKITGSFGQRVLAINPPIYATTASNEFFGNQTIHGDVIITSGSRIYVDTIEEYTTNADITLVNNVTASNNLKVFGVLDSSNSLIKGTGIDGSEYGSAELYYINFNNTSSRVGVSETKTFAYYTDDYQTNNLDIYANRTEFSKPVIAPEFTGSLSGIATYSTKPVNYIGTTLFSTVPQTMNVSPSYSIFLGEQAGQNTTSSVIYAVYLGYNAGYSATNATSSVFIGLSPGYQSDNAHDSVFIGTSAGSRASYASSSVFLGKLAGYQAASASNSILLGYNVGRNTAANTGIGNNNIIIGNNITLEDNRKDSINIGSIIFATGSTSTTGLYPYSGSSVNGKVGINVVKPQYTLDVSGSGNFTGPVYANITGSLSGTGSWATNAISSSAAVSSSYALSASYAPNSVISVSASYAATSSWAYNVVSASNSQTASFALTASNAPNYLPLAGGTITGNLNVVGTASIAYLNVVYQTSSVIYSSGSNQLGDASNDVQTLYGTVNLLTGSLNVLAGAVNAQVFSGSGQYLYNIPVSAISGSISGSGGGGGGTISGSGVSGQVTYWNGTTGITGSSNLFWDNANVRLGVGINNPQRGVHIHTPSTGLVSFQLTNTTSGTGSLDGFQVYGDGTNYVFGNFENGYAAYLTNALERMRIHASGNIAIGSTSDSGYRLDINGSGAASGSLRVSGSSLFDIVTGSFAVNSGSSTFLFVSSSGNVGIGTRSPSYPLEISTNVNAASGIIVTNTNISGLARSRVAVVNNAGEGGYLSCWGTGTGLANKTLFESTKDFLIGTDSNTASGGTSKFQIYVNGYNYALNPQLTLNSTGNLLLGTTTDSGFRLDVNGSTRITTGLTVSGSGGAAYALTTTNGWVQFGSTTGLTWDNTNSRLGIGTNAPATSLHVISTGTQVPLKLEAGSTANNTMILNHAGNYNAIQLNNNAGTPAEAGVIGFGNSSATIVELRNSFYFLNNISNVPSGNIRFTRYNGSSILVDGAFTQTGNFLLNTITDSGYRLDINGSGSASGSLRVVSGSSMFNGGVTVSGSMAIRDTLSLTSVNANAVGGDITFNNRILTNTIAPTTGATISISNGSGFSFLGGGPQSSVTRISLITTWQFSSGTGTGTGVTDTSTINVTSTGTGTYYSFLASPTITSLAGASYRAFQWNNNSGWGLYGQGTAANFLSGSLSIGTTVTSSALTVYKSGSTVVDVQGSTGQLFSVVDTMTGSLMSVNDISGLPILSVNSNGAMYMNSTTQNSLTGSFVVYSLDSTSANAGYFDYRVQNPTTSGSRAGTLMAVWYGSNVEYTDTSTNDLIADTTGITLTADITGSLLRVNATITTGSWNIKIGARLL